MSFTVVKGSVDLYDLTSTTLLGTLSLIAADTGEFSIEAELIWQANTAWLGMFRAHSSI